MNWNISFINGLVLGLVHTDSVLIEDVETEEIESGHGILIYLGFIEIALFW